MAMQQSKISNKQTLIEIMTVAAVLAVAAAVYAGLFDRSNVLSHSIGYNLYASERVLEGEVPYRDFHTLYPPATFYLNALLFKWLGVSLHSALFGVLIFKILTILMIYLSGRQVMPRGWALWAALLSFLWLRPNGPFKSVPMHYGALLLALAMFLLLKFENKRKLVLVFLAGASMALVAMFKHNIGAYALAGSVVFLLFSDVRQTSVCRGKAEDTTEPGSDKLKFVGHGAAKGASGRLSDKLKFAGRYRLPFILLAGFAAVIVPALALMQFNRALAPMIRTLLFGPGEFLLSRLVIPLSPVAPVLLLAGLMASAYALHKLRSRRSLTAGLLVAVIAATSVFLLCGNEADVNQIIFYFPMLVLAAGLVYGLFGRALAAADRRSTLILFIFSAAALMEVFPRFAREQSIAAMPFVMLLLFYLLYLSRPAIDALADGTFQYRLAIAVLPITFALIEGRLFFNTYFDDALRFRAGTQVSTERGRGVYFPAATAALIDNAVSYIHQRVPAGGNAFAQSDAGTSLLFLANRRNVSNAQFWIGVGVTEEERTATLHRIDKSQTKLIITSDEVLASEKYEPMRDYIERNFKPTLRFDDVVMLER